MTERACRCRQSVFIAWNPHVVIAFILDENNVCVDVPSRTRDGYIGKSREEIGLAMSSIMRYEDGTEPQPNVGHSANGYPSMWTIRPEGW